MTLTNERPGSTADGGGERRTDGAPGGAPELFAPTSGPVVAVVKTYRYLRLGMVLVVVVLASAIVLERLDAGCWRDSISAYYYSPARSVFVGALCAIGFALIVIKGSPAREDVCLNVAGALAPLVAFIPTTDVGACSGGRTAGDLPVLAPGAKVDVDNNVEALLVAGVLALALAAVLYVNELRRSSAADRTRAVATGAGIAAGFVALAAGYAVLRWDPSIDIHGKAALGMFGVLALAAILDGQRAGRGGAGAGYRIGYLLVGVLMAVGGPLIVWGTSWELRVLIAESYEIALFVAFWIIQSVERWGRDDWREVVNPAHAATVGDDALLIT